LREKSARISVGSFLLRARALFSTETVARVRNLVELPEPLPFSGITVETVHVPRYRSTFNLAELLESAREELASSRPEQYKIFLLGALAGLRRNEIDVLPWTAFRFGEGVIRIETTEFYRPKSHNSEGDVLMDPELLEIFQGYYARRKSDFVIESDSPPVPFDAPYGVYRCQNHMRALLGWLRGKGVVSKTPLHALKKQFGSEIHARYGLLAASEALRHGGIAGDRPSLRREQATLGPRIRTSSCRQRTSHHSDGRKRAWSGVILLARYKRRFPNYEKITLRSRGLAFARGDFARRKGNLYITGNLQYEWSLFVA
jgi:hypothetical protein